MKRLFLLLFLCSSLGISAQPFSPFGVHDVSLGPLGVAYEPQTFYIRQNDAGYCGFLAFDSGHNYLLVLYETNTYQIKVLSLPVAYFNDGAAAEMEMIGTNLFVCGTSSFGLNPIMYHFGLSSETPLPNSLTLITNFNVGDTSSRNTVMTRFANGGLVWGASAQSNSYTAYVVYRSPSGTWTNEGPIAMSGGGSTPTLITAAEQLVDGSWWFFATKDGGGEIRANQFVVSGSGLALNQSFQLVNNQTSSGNLIWGSQAPYGEICMPVAISDNTSNRIILLYNNSDFTGAAPVRQTGLAAVGFKADTNHYLFGYASNHIYRLFSSYGDAQIGTNHTISYSEYETLTITNAPFPIQIQTISDGFSTPSVQVAAGDVYNGRVIFHPHRNDFVYHSNNDLTFHLLIIYSGSTLKNLSITGNATLTGNILIR